MTNAEIIASANVTDPERFRYEVESKAENPSKAGLSYYSNDIIWLSIWDDSTFYYNSQGEPVATFKLKQWK